MTRSVTACAGWCRGVCAAAKAGVLATLTMDAAMAGAEILGKDAFSSPRLSLQMIGRWACDLACGKWRPEDMLSRPARSGEAAFGILTHYATGIGLTAVYLAIGRGWRPTLKRATAYGIATSALPLLVMFPSMGYGAFGLRSGEAPRLIRIMLLGHTAFGLGIGIAAGRANAPRVPRPVVLA